jgi:hypothetical protein
MANRIAQSNGGQPDSTAKDGHKRIALDNPTRGVHAGSTPLSFEVFGRHRRRADSSEPRGFPRPRPTCRDT